MTLRRKALLSVLVTMIGLLTILYLVSKVILVDSAVRMETADVQAQVGKVRDYLSGEIVFLRVQASNWATWDDTVSFLAGHNPNYLDANFSCQAFEGLDLDFLVILDSQDQLGASRACDRQTYKLLPVDANFLDVLLKDSALHYDKLPTDGLAGILLTSSGPVLLAAQPIVPSSAQGPARGTLIFGRRLSSDEIHSIGKATGVDVQAFAKGDPQMPADMQSESSRVSPGGAAAVAAVGTDQIAGYQWVPDVHNQPGLLLRVTSADAVLAESQRTLRSLILAILLAGPLFGTLILVLLERLVLAPLAGLSASVAGIARTGSPSERVRMAGHDELASLGSSINAMLAALERSHEDVRRAYRQNQQLLAAISSILIAVDEADCVTLWNEIAEKTFGMTPGETIGRALVDCGIRWDRAAIEAQIQKCRSQEQPVLLRGFFYQRPGGRDGLLNLDFSTFQGQDSAGSGILILGDDITQQSILEAQLAAAQKLQAIGQLAAGIAHEINTPAQYVGDNMLFLQQAFADLQPLLEADQMVCDGQDGLCPSNLAECVRGAIDPSDLSYYLQEVPGAVDRALEGINRVTQIVRAMREFSHPGSKSKAPADLNRAIASTITVARNEYKHVADVTTDFDANLPPVTCLAGEVNQVVLNLLVNAAHAIADATSNGKTGKGTIAVSTRRDGSFVEIRVADTGSGIPEEIRSRVFDPFFTTKEPGKGTGQGLSLAHSVIVEQHSGTIHFETQMGVGTTFIVRLPLEGA
jgi:PAS domain S-box-containing protein